MRFGSSKPEEQTASAGGSGADAPAASVADAPPPSGGVEAGTAAGLALPSADMTDPPPAEPDPDIDNADIDTFAMARESDRPTLPTNVVPIVIEKSDTIEQVEAGIDPTTGDYWLGLMPNSHHSTVVLGGIAFHYRTIREAGSDNEMPLRGSIVKLTDKQVKLITAQAARKVFRSRGGAWSIYDTASQRYTPRIGDRCVARDIFMVPMPPAGQRGPFWNEAQPVAMLTG